MRIGKLAPLLVFLAASLPAGRPAVAGARGDPVPGAPGSPGPVAKLDVVPEGPLRRFDGSGLYGHIDGGAELFLEFGFEELTVRSYRVGTWSLALEAYRMDSPLAALGIYLAKCGRESPLAGVEARNTGNRYQLLLVKGATYCQVHNFAGDQGALPAMAALAAQATAGIPAADPPKIWRHLPAADQVPGSVRLIRGPYALEPITTLGPGDVLQLGGRIFGAVADYQTGDGAVTTRIAIPYPDEAAAGAVLAALPARLDSYSEVVGRWPGGLSFRDFESRYGLVRVLGRVLNLHLHLPAEPDPPAGP